MHDHGRGRSRDDGGKDQECLLRSGSVTTSDLATAVSRAAAGFSNAELADAAGMAPRTLRAILSGDGARRFGRKTLDKLDEPLGWLPGTAWRLYRQGVPVADVDEVGSISEWMDDMSRRIAELEGLREPSWVEELVELCRALSDEDRDVLLTLARRLNRRRV